MLDAPLQNWNLLEARLRSENRRWLRSLSVDDKMTLYESLHRLSIKLGGTSSANNRLQERHWQEKLVVRKKSRAIFMQLDLFNESRAGRTNTG